MTRKTEKKKIVFARVDEALVQYTGIPNTISFHLKPL